MEAGRVCGNDRRPNLAAVSGPVPGSGERLRRAVFRDVRARAGPSGPAPSACAGQSVRVSFPVVATVGSCFRPGAKRRRRRSAQGGRILDRTGGARALPIRHRGVGQHALSRLPLSGDSLLRTYQARRLYVRGGRASGWKSRGAQRGAGPFGIEGAALLVLPPRKKSPVRGGLL